MGVTTNDDGDPDDKGARDAALELLKQLITLSSGVLALSATFVEKFASPVWWLMLLLGASWALLISALLCGLQAISTIVQGLRISATGWAEGKARKFAMASKWTFVAGMIAFAAFAFLAAEVAVRSKAGSSKEPPGAARTTVIVQ